MSDLDPNLDPLPPRRTPPSNGGWYAAAGVAIVAILAVAYIATRSPQPTADQQAAATQAQVAGAQSTQAAQDASVAAQTAAQSAAQASA